MDENGFCVHGLCFVIRSVDKIVNIVLGTCISARRHGDEGMPDQVQCDIHPYGRMKQNVHAYANVSDSVYLSYIKDGNYYLNNSE